MLSKNQIKLIKSLESKKFRKREGLFVAEGPKVVGDLLRAGYQPHSIYATPQCSLSNIPCSTSNIQFSTITDDELHRISFLQHPQEVLAIFHIPTPLDSSNLHLPSDICLALDGGHHHPYCRLVWHQSHFLFTRYCRHIQSQSGASYNGQSGSHYRHLLRPGVIAPQGYCSHLWHLARRTGHLPTATVP